MIKSELEEEKIRKVINTYGDMIYKIAFSYCKSHADAEDIYQNVFMKYFQHQKQFENSTHEKAWLIRVTVNFSKSFLRSSWHKRILPFEDNMEELAFIDKNNDLLYAVLELPVKYREVIHLYYYEGYSTREISLLLKRRETTVRTQLQRGRDILRVNMKEELSYEY